MNIVWRPDAARYRNIHILKQGERNMLRQEECNMGTLIGILIEKIIGIHIYR